MDSSAHLEVRWRVRSESCRVFPSGTGIVSGRASVSLLGFACPADMLCGQSAHQESVETRKDTHVLGKEKGQGVFL